MDKLTYKKIKNFLTESEVNLLAEYCKLRTRFPNSTEDIIWVTDKNIPVDKAANFKFNFHKDVVMESLLLNKQKQVEDIVGEELWPTYTHWRPYFFGNDLKKHKDRPSCEISLSVCIDKDKTEWPLFINDVPIELDKGDAVISAGTEFKHYREKFEGDYCVNVFLHYVRKNGIYKDFKYDKRMYVGTNKTSHPGAK